MKHLLSNSALSLLTRAFLGSFFIVISIDKIADPAAFVQSIANYKILPSLLVQVTGTILPWVELLAGLTILFGILPRGGSLLLCTMLGVFSIAVISALLRGLDISCGCFTQDPTAGTIGWMKVAENGSLFLLSLFLLFSKTGPLSLESFVTKRGSKERD